MIRRLIFDIDGTLIRNVKFDEAIKRSFIEFGIYSEENVKNFIDGISKYEEEHEEYDVKQYLEFFSKKLNVKLNEHFLEVFWPNLAIYSVPKDCEKIKNMIEDLSKKYELVLLSNYFEKSQRGRLESMGINKFFHEYYGEKIMKPNHKAFEEAIGNFNPSECVMIGDNAEFDIIPAQKCGLKTIWINSKNVIRNDINTLTIDDTCIINENLINSLDK